MSWALLLLCVKCVKCVHSACLEVYLRAGMLVVPVCPVKKRRYIQILKMVFKSIRGLHKIKDKFANDFIIYESSRNGLFCRIPTNYNQKDFFVFAAKLFNSLPKCIRNEKSLTKFNILLEDFL